MKSNTKEQMKSAVIEVVRQQAILSPADLVVQLSEIERKRQQLMKMLDWCRDAIENPIDDEQYQMLMDFMYLQAAKKGIDSDQMLIEVQFKYVIEDLRDLPTRNLWDALTFIKAYS